AIVTLLQELFSGRAMRPAAGSRLRDDTEVAVSHAKPVAAEATGREEPYEPASAEWAAIEPVVTERAGGESVAVEPEPQIAAAAKDDPPVPVGAKPALAEEVDLSGPAVAGPVFTDIVPGAIQPAKHEPVPEMKGERESFTGAWARHRRIMDAAKHEAV